MKVINKKCLFSIFFICLVSGLMAQAALNPADDFYTDAYRWETAGYVDRLPDIRPFTPEVIKGILNAVIDSGNAREAELAESYLKELNESAVIYAQGDIRSKETEEGTSLVLSGNAGLEGRIGLADNLSIAYDLGFNAIRGEKGNVVPEYSTLPYDTADDPMTVAGFEINLNMNDIVSYGNENFFFQAGISRSSFGSFPYSSVVFESSTAHAPHIGFGVNTEHFIYEQQLYALSASDNYGKNHFAGKYLALHSIRLPLTDTLSLSYYETMVYGGRIDIAYMIPAPFMVSQAFSSFGDNMQMGINVDWKNGRGFNLSGNLYVDDVSANDLSKLKFDTKLIFAGQLTAAYVPQNSSCRIVYAEGLLIAPRMYAHSDVVLQKDGTYTYSAGNAVNYQNYTHNGESIGSKVWPNSVKFQAGTEFDLTSALRLKLGASYTCHANVNETIETEEAKKYLNPITENCKTDGSVLNFPGFEVAPDAGTGLEAGTNDYPDSYLDHFPFLEQQSKMHVIQLSCDLDYSFNITEKLKCKICLSEVFEYVQNFGVQNEIFAPQGRSATDADVENALTSWRNKLSDVIGNYATLSVKLMF